MLSINTNTSSLIAQNSMKSSTNKLNQAIERMTTGAKINHAKDNAANYSIATNMTTKINAYQIAEDNVSMGLDILHTASSSLSLIGDLTSRLRALTVQAQNGTFGSRSLDAINSEAKAIVQEMSRIKNNTEFDGIKLLTSAANGFIHEVKRRNTSSMTTLESVDENTALTRGTYSISTAKELAKLATMTRNGLIGQNTEFVLANDIDLSAYSSGEGWVPIGSSKDYKSMFKASFDGNGYIVSNLYINRPNTANQGLFGICNNAKISNLGVKNADVTGSEHIATLVGNAQLTKIYNCYATGDVTSTFRDTGILMGAGGGTEVSNCYSTGNVNGKTNFSGGLGGSCGTSTFINCYSDAYVAANGGTSGGLIGVARSATIKNCYYTGYIKKAGDTGCLVGNGENATFENSYCIDRSGLKTGIGRNTPKSGTVEIVTESEIAQLIKEGILPEKISEASEIVFNLQAGIDSSKTSQIDLVIKWLDISAIEELDLNDKNAISAIDDLLATINSNQTKLGATQNKLESALDAISTQYTNLVSSRSTIKDADIAEVSSEYIKMQILQQASATLMATANQSPAVALQLL